jgi:hypothetical protein
MSDLCSELDQLKVRWRLLLFQWDQARESWGDTVGDRFERTVWAEFERTVPDAIESLERLEQLTSRIEGSLGHLD